ncbi:MAG: hypothetical protein LBV02_04235, partial [Bacteroidales bacterium]|nr:hypothetical protein [Bacteroidales bacterium]
MIDIKFPDNTSLPVQVTDASSRYRSIMGKNEVTLKFALAEYVHFPAGCWMEYKGITYYCLTEGSYTKNARNEYQYTVVFEPHAGKLRLWTLRNLVTNEFKFSSVYTPREALKLIVDGLNDRDPETAYPWQEGECIEADHKFFDFNNTKLDVALAMIASEFNTEFEIEGKTIHLRKVEHGKDNPTELSYGKGNGFLPGVGVISSGRQAQFEILLVQGGNQNLDSEKYQGISGFFSPSWHLPRNATYTTENKVTYQTDEKGREVTIAGKDLSTHADFTLDLSEMYPKREGFITAVKVVEVDENGKEGREEDYYGNPDSIPFENYVVDIIDESIPADLDYNDYITPGEKRTITFQSGVLIGRTFDLDENNGYDHAKRRFRLVTTTHDGAKMPFGFHMPAAGDRYAVFGVTLPKKYVEQLEWDMFKEACRYFDEKNVVPFSFTGTIDPNWITSQEEYENRAGMLKPGYFVKFSDPDFKPDGYDVRIVGMRDYANDKYKVSVELSNEKVSASLSTEFAKLDGEKQRLDREKAGLMDYNKRSYADVKRTTEMLINAGLSEFSESIQPLTVQTMQLLVGATECQFVFVDRKTEPQQVVDRSQVYDKENLTLTCEGGILKHMTIGIDFVGASHKADEYRYWKLEAKEFTLDSDDKGGRYLYACCEKDKNSETGYFKISATAITLDQDPNNYHFLVGILNPEINNDRSYAPMYGFAAIEPGRMIVDKIQSSDFDPDAFTGACIDLQSDTKQLILGENAEIITRKLTIRPPDSDDYDLVEHTDTEIKRVEDSLHLGEIYVSLQNTKGVDTESGTEWWGNITINGKATADTPSFINVYHTSVFSSVNKASATKKYAQHDLKTQAKRTELFNYATNKDYIIIVCGIVPGVYNEDYDIGDYYGYSETIGRFIYDLLNTLGAGLKYVNARESGFGDDVYISFIGGAAFASKENCFMKIGGSFYTTDGFLSGDNLDDFELFAKVTNNVMTGTGSKKDFDAMATKYIKEAIAGSTSING